MATINKASTYMSKRYMLNHFFFSHYYDGFFPPGPSYFITEYSHPKQPEELSLEILKSSDLSLKNYRGRTILYEAQTRGTEFAKKVLELGIDIADRYSP